MKIRTCMAMLLSATFIASCGGGGGNNGQSQKSVISGRVPYLISAPSITYKANAFSPADYDVTVTLEADGPAGVMYASLWIFEEVDNSNFTSLDLVRIGATKLWTATTNAYLPLQKGRYYVDSIVLEDGDTFTADPLRTGWYSVMPIFSGSYYYVDEREMSGLNFLFYNMGLSSIPIARFTLP